MKDVDGGGREFTKNAMENSFMTSLNLSITRQVKLKV
jgi:hypothetical protein